MKNFISERGMAILLMTLFSLSISTEAFAQRKKKEISELQQEVKEDNGNTIALVVSGTGATKEMATTNALRSALEQAYGTFVSANTQVINDELIKDEIVSISSGNIHKYEEISCADLPSGEYEISLRAVVSIDKLISFAQNHGMDTELSGQTFLMNRKIALLNKENEKHAITNLITRVANINAKGLFDFSIEVGQPRDYKDSLFRVPVKVKIVPNKNMDIFFQTIDETFSSLCMSDAEEKNYAELGMKTYLYTPFYFHYNDGSHQSYSYISEFDRNKIMLDDPGYYHTKMKAYRLRDNHDSNQGCQSVSNNIAAFFFLFLENSAFYYTIYDNIGTNITPCYVAVKELRGDYLEWESFKRFHIPSWESQLVYTLEPLFTATHKPIVANLKKGLEQQEFDIIYTYEELSRLQKISIKPCFDIHGYRFEDWKRGRQRD